MSPLAVAHPRRVHLRPLPDLPPEPPVTVTISIAGGAAPGRDRILAALRDLVDLAAVSVVETETAGGIRLDPRARTAIREGAALELSRLEFDLLLFLAERPRRVFTRGQLLAGVWGYEHTGERTVDVHVRRLRLKLGGNLPVITTVYGVGYRLSDEARIVVQPHE